MLKDYNISRLVSMLTTEYNAKYKYDEEELYIVTYDRKDNFLKEVHFLFYKDGNIKAWIESGDVKEITEDFEFIIENKTKSETVNFSFTDEVVMIASSVFLKKCEQKTEAIYRNANLYDLIGGFKKTDRFKYAGLLGENKLFTSRFSMAEIKEVEEIINEFKKVE